MFCCGNDEYMLDSFDIVVAVSEIERCYGIVIAISDINIDSFKNRDSINKMIKRNGGVV